MNIKFATKRTNHAAPLRPARVRHLSSAQSKATFQSAVAPSWYLSNTVIRHSQAFVTTTRAHIPTKATGVRHKHVLPQTSDASSSTHQPVLLSHQGLLSRRNAEHPRVRDVCELPALTSGPPLHPIHVSFLRPRATPRLASRNEASTGPALRALKVDVESACVARLTCIRLPASSTCRRPRRQRSSPSRRPPAAKCKFEGD